MVTRIVGLMIGMMMFAVSFVSAQDDADAQATKNRLKEISKEIKDLNKSLSPKKKELGKDEELKALKEAVVEAQKAYDAKLDEKLAADPESAELMKKMEALQAEMKELKQLIRDEIAPEKSLGHSDRKSEGA